MLTENVLMVPTGCRPRFPNLDVNVKLPRKLYRIGEVILHTGLSRQTVHNYTTMGLISESEWTAGGHRLYDESVFERLALIEQLKRTRTLRQISAMLSTLAASGPLANEVSPDGSQ